MQQRAAQANNCVPLPAPFAHRQRSPPTAQRWHNKEAQSSSIIKRSCIAWMKAEELPGHVPSLQRSTSPVLQAIQPSITKVSPSSGQTPGRQSPLWCLPQAGPPDVKKWRHGFCKKDISLDLAHIPLPQTLTKKGSVMKQQAHSLRPCKDEVGSHP